MSDVAPEDVRSNKTAYLAAYSFGLSAPQSEISMAWHAWKAVDPGIVHGKKRRSEGQAALDRLAQQPELEFLPHCLREWCHLRAGVSASNAHILNPHCLREWCHLRAGVSASNADIPDTVQVVSSVVLAPLAARVEWLTSTADTPLQTVHAHPHYHNKPWFDRVSVYTTDEPNGTLHSPVWFAERRLWFRLGDVLLAFVRWFQQQRAEPYDVLAKNLGCTPLSWEHDPATRNRGRYQVIGALSIRAWIHSMHPYIVPNFVRELGPDGECIHFHVSPFKWDRPPPDISGFAQDDN
eukprot:350068-Chlamydomonas_euryale.AAC.2